ncbi:MAG: PD40 domain-containing protein [Acidobacteria bacterium]|nr:PD40 domain-containing protein [Acidobacteriota bacterium]
MPKYEQLTFRRGLITHARFSPDGQTIIYSAEWGGKPGEIFTTRGGIGQSRSLDLKDADVLSVSSTGELAILIKRQYLGQLTHKGTLARVRFSAALRERFWKTFRKRIGRPMARN